MSESRPVYNIQPETRVRHLAPRQQRGRGGVAQYTEHLAWLLFLKFLDETELQRRLYADAA